MQNPDPMVIVGLAAFAVIMLIMAVLFLRWWKANPFHYPYFDHEFDVSGKRNVDIEDLIDGFLCSTQNRNDVKEHERTIRLWKKRQERWLQTHRFRKHRTRQYEKACDDGHAFRFTTIRQQTRYHQVDYERIPYKVQVEDDSLEVDAAWVDDRIGRLADIGYETTLKNYMVKNQRKLMTPSLRRKIMERDDYTCQICGKRMRDGVGLHIDHIIPVAKGGKSVPSNLQVLCSKCNGSKSDRMPVQGRGRRPGRIAKQAV